MINTMFFALMLIIYARTPLDSCVNTLNNRTPSYISELKILLSQMWHNPTAIVCMQTANPLTRLRRLVTERSLFTHAISTKIL